MDSDDKFIQTYEASKLKVKNLFYRAWTDERIIRSIKNLKGLLTDFSDEISNAKKYVKNNVLGNEYLTLVYDFVEKSSDKKDVKLNLKGQSFTITYKERKLAVLGLTMLSMASLVLFRRKLKIFARNGIFVYLSLSFFICRENLNPFN
jgi:hypothetical protein